MSGFTPPIHSLLPRQAFEGIINAAGVRMQWCKSHACPCVYSSAGQDGLPIAGSPEPACQTCFGVGTYWDAPSAPFTALVTFTHMSPTPDEPGIKTDPRYGPVTSSEPAITIPYATAAAPNTPLTVWQQCSTDDMLIEVDAQARYNAYLQVGGVSVIPFQASTVIAPSGAVSVYNTATRQVEYPNTYTLNGPTITLSGYPDQTTFLVEFFAAPIYIIYRSAGGLPHSRPFGSGQENEPRKFRGQTLDVWTRERRISTNASTGTIPGTNVPLITLASFAAG